MAKTFKKHWKVDIKLLLYCPIYWISLFYSKYFAWVCSLTSSLIKLLKSFKPYLLLGIKLFDFFIFCFFKTNFWNIWINVLMELIENLEVTQSIQSQLIKLKSVQSFRGVLTTHLKIYWNFSFCPLNSTKCSNVHVWLGPQYLHPWSWQ